MCCFIKNIFTKGKKTETVEEQHMKIDVEFIVKKLEEWENIELFLEFCDLNNITRNCEDVEKDNGYEQTEYKLKVIASDLLYKLNISINHFQLMRINKVKEWVAKQEKMKEKYGISQIRI